jgi:hypothetical protein
MSEEQNQSPHYIPELDPANKRRPSAIGEKIIAWFQYLMVAALISSGVLAGLAWFMGWDEVFMWSAIIAGTTAISLISLIFA